MLVEAYLGVVYSCLFNKILVFKEDFIPYIITPRLGPHLLISMMVAGPHGEQLINPLSTNP